MQSTVNQNPHFNIEDVIEKNLRGEQLKNAKDLIAFLKTNDILPENTESDCWHYRNKALIVIHSYDYDDNMWFIYGNVENIEGFPINDELKEFVWKNVRICSKCGCPGMPRGGNKTILGKEFENTCDCDIWFMNPDSETLELFKKFMMLTKYNIDNNIPK